jgi:hypothetical protein
VSSKLKSERSGNLFYSSSFCNFGIAGFSIGNLIVQHSNYLAVVNSQFFLVNKLTYDKNQGVSHCGLVIYIKKYLKAKEELGQRKYLTMQKYNLQRNPLKEAKILQDVVVTV